MNITIIGQVTDENKEYHEIKLYHHEIEAMIENKAKLAGIEGYEGRVWKHLDERIIGVEIDD